MPSTISVAQLGARMHYAVPRILYAAGVLERLFTDATATAPWAQILNRVPEQLRPAGLTMLLGRIPKGLPLECISAFERFGWEYALRSRLALGRGQDVETEVHLWAGKKFCQLVLDKGLGQAEGVYTYNSAALELLEHTRQRGNFGILEQVIAPAQVEDSLHAAEEIANPGWESATAIRASRRELASREKSEWENADVILCPSEFVRRGIEECSGPAERCVVVPYGVDASAALCSHKQTKSALRVLICGAVGLRKGAPYAAAAARSMRGGVDFRWVGSVCLLPRAISTLNKHIELRGPVPRTLIAEEYAWADVFLLPTICEGSATVCYEALAAGLPVITTPNAGSVVRDGVDGFVVPIRDPEAIARSLDVLARNRELLTWMSENARERAREFTVEKYGERVIAALQNSAENAIKLQ